ncbi:MAG: hypothetical protein JWM86_2774 [Thermoleophilia bacterium]|nr:hypothetical protein [Thermoleophilia bacterium]
MSSGPFQRRSLFGYEPARVDHAIAAQRRALDAMRDELEASQARCRQLEAAREAELRALRVPGGEPAWPELALKRRLFGVRRREVLAHAEALHELVLDERHRSEQLAVRLTVADRALDTFRARQRELDELSERVEQEADERVRRAAEQARSLVDEAGRTATAIVAEARAEGSRTRARLEGELVPLRTSIERLTAVRARLASGLHDAMDDLDRALDRLPDPEPASAESAPGRLEDPLEAPLDEPTSDPLEGADEDCDSLAAAALRDLRHVATVLHVRDYAQLSGLVRELESLPGVLDVFVQAYHGTTAELAIHVEDAAVLDEATERIDALMVQASGGSRDTLRLRLLDTDD